MTMPQVRVVPYDTDWPSAFAREADRILAGVSFEVMKIHHIGSTAVPGIYAKPIIDILIEVKDIEAVDRHATDMTRLGYEAMGAYGIPGRRYFRRHTDGHRSHHVHAYPTGHSEIERHLVFRDFLRVNRRAADRYARHKLKAAARYPDDLSGYAEAKADFVAAMEADALAWAGSIRESR